MAAEQLEKADAEFEQFKTEYSKLSDELRSLKEHSPESAPILSDFTPFQDIPATATAPLLVCLSLNQLAYLQQHRPSESSLLLLYFGNVRSR